MRTQKPAAQSAPPRIWQRLRLSVPGRGELGKRQATGPGAASQVQARDGSLTRCGGRAPARRLRAQGPAVWHPAAQCLARAPGPATAEPLPSHLQAQAAREAPGLRRPHAAAPAVHGNIHGRRAGGAPVGQATSCVHVVPYIRMDATGGGVECQGLEAHGAPAAARARRGPAGQAWLVPGRREGRPRAPRPDAAPKVRADDARPAQPRVGTPPQKTCR
mmetsp:Transcript_3841/g.12829  ORF Transcript_3841/g.12829 Transcript_3841/m.12829 type:complete len:218 (+) Transcript_3841:207-860(+)